MDNKMRITDIARLANVSVGTVDRVLHQRGNVTQEKRERIEAILQMAEYKPNPMARSLALKRDYAIAILIPSHTEGDYWQAVTKGIERAGKENGIYNIGLYFFLFDQYNESSFSAALARLNETTFDGAVIATLFPKATIQLSAQLTLQNIPYCYIDAHIEGQQPLAYFGTDSQAAGRLIARLLCDRLSFDNKIITAFVDREDGQQSVQQQNRLHGFLEYMSKMRPDICILNIGLQIGNRSQNRKILADVLEKYPEIKAAAMFNSTAYLLAEALNDNDRDNIIVAGCDLIAPNRAWMEKGRITYLIGQQPEMQGYQSISTLVRYLMRSDYSTGVCHMPIDIVVQENMNYYSF